MADLQFHACVDGERLAYRFDRGREPSILWLGGFHSDMGGTKAESLAAWARAAGRSFLRFDYYGHGQSSGEFRFGTISRWRDDALAVLDKLAEGPQILVGSSMGGWIATLLAQVRPERIAGMLLIAPAPDFTEALAWEQMSPDIRRQIIEQGFWMRPADEPYPITRELIEDGRKNFVLDKALTLSAPVRILHGTADQDVPWQHGKRLLEVLNGDVTFTLVKDADHRMSSPQQLQLIERTLEGLLKDIDG